MKKKNYIFSAAVLLMASAMVVSCTSDDMTSETTNGKNVVTAKAILDGTTRVAYNENTSGGGSGITAEWQSTDYLNVQETNGSTMTVCKFSISTINTDKTAIFTSSNAVTPDADTQWMAVLGKGATVSGTTITCGYDDQVGTLDNLEKYDYRLAWSSGTAPTFDFTAAKEAPLSYFLRLKLPAGIKQIEFCSGSWSITGDVPSVKASTDNVSTVTLGNTSAAGEIVYVAVPAIDYSTVGLIITIFNDLKANATQSQGKVISRNLENLGGQIGDYDLSGLTLMARPISSVDMGTAGKWAPFNVGATTATDYGNYYAWGKTEQSYDAGTTTLDYAWETYFPKVSGASESTCGTSNDPIFAAGAITSTTSGSTTTWSGSICNTKFDVARVKWGKGWKMPTYDQIDNLRKLTTSWTTSYNGVNVNGCSITSSNNASTTLFLPAAGVYDGSSITNKVSTYWQGTLYSDADDEGEYCLKIFPSTNALSTDYIYRYTGSSVRPIAE